MADAAPTLEVPGIGAYANRGVPDYSTAQKAAMALGLNTPIARGLFVGSVVGAGLWVVQPEISFVQGEPRQFGDGGVPWWVFAAGAIVATQYFT